MSEELPKLFRPDAFFVAVWVFFVALGLVLAFLYLPPEWGLGQKLAVGLLGGAFSALILTANRLLGAYTTKE